MGLVEELGYEGLEQEGERRNHEQYDERCPEEDARGLQLVERMTPDATARVARWRRWRKLRGLGDHDALLDDVVGKPGVHRVLAASPEIGVDVLVLDLVDGGHARFWRHTLEHWPVQRIAGRIARLLHCLTLLREYVLDELLRFRLLCLGDMAVDADDPRDQGGGCEVRGLDGGDLEACTDTS